MAANGTYHRALPRDLMEMQLGQIDLILAMYASDDAVSMNEGSSSALEELRSWCEGDEDTPPLIADPSISLLLTLDASESDSDASTGERLLQLDIAVPVTSQSGEISTSSLDPPKAKVRVRQPAWMTKSEAAQLTNEMPDDDLLSVIEHVKGSALQHVLASQQAASADAKASMGEATIRVWFYFPSISTRAKRDDLINYAPLYGLTGFLLAGKPGVLCLEGGSQAIDDYMKFIKTESWGDIPSQHKKVSERYRETGPSVKRAFENMREITDMVGERRGERANRNDMKALEAWLNENGLGEAFGKVLI